MSETGMKKEKTVYRYEINEDGTLRNGQLFFDFTKFKGEEAIDGIKVDVEGNLYVSAPGGWQWQLAVAVSS